MYLFNIRILVFDWRLNKRFLNNCDIISFFEYFVFQIFIPVVKINLHKSRVIQRCKFSGFAGRDSIVAVNDISVGGFDIQLCNIVSRLFFTTALLFSSDIISSFAGCSLYSCN